MRSKLWGTGLLLPNIEVNANCAVLMQIMTFTFHNLRCFVANDICVASEIRALAGTFGSAIRRLILLMMSGGKSDESKASIEKPSTKLLVRNIPFQVTTTDMRCRNDIKL